MKSVDQWVSRLGTNHCTGLCVVVYHLQHFICTVPSTQSFDRSKISFAIASQQWFGVRRVLKFEVTCCVCAFVKPEDPVMEFVRVNGFYAAVTLWPALGG